MAYRDSVSTGGGIRITSYSLSGQTPNVCLVYTRPANSHFSLMPGAYWTLTHCHCDIYLPRLYRVQTVV